MSNFTYLSAFVLIKLIHTGKRMRKHEAIGSFLIEKQKGELSGNGCVCCDMGAEATT